MAFWDTPSGSLTLKQQHRWVVSFGDSDYQQSDTNPVKNQIPFYFAKSVDQPSFSIKTVQAKYLFSHTFNFPTRPIWNAVNITFYDVIMDNVQNSSFIVDPTVDSYEIFKKQQKVTRRNQAPGTYIKEYLEFEEVSFRQSTQIFFYSMLQNAGYITPAEYDSEDRLIRFRKYNFKKDMIKALVGASPDYKQNTLNGFDIKFENNTVDTAAWKYLAIRQIDVDGKIVEGWRLYNPMVTDVKFDRLDYSNDAAVTITAKIEYDWAKIEGGKSLGQIKIAPAVTEPPAIPEKEKIPLPDDVLKKIEQARKDAEKEEFKKAVKTIQDETDPEKVQAAESLARIAGEEAAEKVRQEYLDSLPKPEPTPEEKASRLSAIDSEIKKLSEQKQASGVQENKDYFDKQIQELQRERSGIEATLPSVETPPAAPVPLPQGVTPDLAKLAVSQTVTPVSPETASGREYTVQEKIEIAKQEIDARTPGQPLSDIAKAYALGELKEPSAVDRAVDELKKRADAEQATAEEVVEPQRRLSARQIRERDSAAEESRPRPNLDRLTPDQLAAKRAEDEKVLAEAAAEIRAAEPKPVPNTPAPAPVPTPTPTAEPASVPTGPTPEQQKAGAVYRQAIGTLASQTNFSNTGGVLTAEGFNPADVQSAIDAYGIITGGGETDLTRVLSAAESIQKTTIKKESNQAAINNLNFRLGLIQSRKNKYIEQGIYTGQLEQFTQSQIEEIQTQLARLSAE